MAEVGLRQTVGIAREVEVVEAIVLSGAAGPARRAGFGLRGVELRIGDVTGDVGNHDDAGPGTQSSISVSVEDDLGDAFVQERQWELSRQRLAIAGARVELQ